MQPPFDLNLMMPRENRDPRELIAMAEAARQLKETGTKSNPQAPKWRFFSSAWILLKERAISKPVVSSS